MGAAPILPVDGRLTCRACRQSLPLDAFYASKHYACGYDIKGCRACASIRAAERNARPEIKARQRIAGFARKADPYQIARDKKARKAWVESAHGIQYRMWHCAKERARNLGLPFDIEKSDVIVPAVCPLLGTPLRKGSGTLHEGSPSLDRIDPSKGYVKGNVWVVSYRANAIKQNASLDELELLVSNLRRRLVPV